MCIYVCMYLPQTTSRPPSIGAQSDFLLSTNRGQESRLEPSVVAFGSAVGLLPAVPHISASACAKKPDVSSAGSGLERPHQVSELGAGCRNPSRAWIACDLAYVHYAFTFELYFSRAPFFTFAKRWPTCYRAGLECVAHLSIGVCVAPEWWFIYNFSKYSWSVAEHALFACLLLLFIYLLFKFHHHLITRWGVSA